MGLAASQAKMLLLTARKSDVEARLMSLSNERLSLSRQSSDLSEKYSAALNATQFAWNTSTGKADLTYDLFMNPSTSVNNSGQYLLQNANTSAVILSNSTASRLGLSNLGNAGDISSLYSQAEFVAKAMGVSSTSGRAQVITDVAKIGRTSTDLASSSKVDDAYQISAFTTAYSDMFVRAELANGGYTATTSGDNVGYPASNGAFVQNFYAPGSEGNAEKLEYVKAALNTVVTDITGDAGAAIMKTLKNNYDDQWSEELAILINTAAAKAQQDTINEYYAKVQSGKYTSTQKSDDARDAIAGTNKVGVATKDEDDWFIDYNQVINSFLNNFDAECAKLNGDNSKANAFFNKNTGNSSTRSTQGTGSTCTVTTVEEAEEEEGTTEIDGLNGNGVSDTYEEKYYMNLYNALMSYGWETNNGMTTENGLQSQLLFGNVSILQLTGGGWSSLSTSDIASPLMSETDDEAINKAEAEYEAAKDRLDYKESQIDTLMNKLDTERSAIEVEVESVQKVIKGNSERSFKIFDA